MTLTLVGVGGRFAHFCAGDGCAVCRWIARREAQEKYDSLYEKRAGGETMEQRNGRSEAPVTSSSQRGVARHD